MTLGDGWSPWGSRATARRRAVGAGRNGGGSWLPGLATGQWPQGCNRLGMECSKLAAATKASGNKPRPSVIVAELAKRGIHVAMAQESVVLKKMGFRPLSKRRKNSESVAAAGTPKAAARKTAAAGSISVDELLAAATGRPRDRHWEGPSGRRARRPGRSP